MPLDPAANFVRDALQSGVTDTDTTFSVSDAAQFPDPATDGEYNVVVWDAADNPRPDQDPDVEIVRVTAVDTSANELTVTRAQENTTAASHPVESGVLLAPTAKDTSDTVAALNARPESPVGGDDLADGLGTGASSRIGGTTYFNSHDSLVAEEKVANSVVFAGHDDFGTLQDAVNFAENNDYRTVIVPPGSYGTITLSQDCTSLIGTTQYGQDFDARVEATEIILDGLYNTVKNFQATDITVNAGRNLVTQTNNSNISITAFSATVIANHGPDVTLSSDTGSVIVTNNQNATITDNGSGNIIENNQ